MTKGIKQHFRSEVANIKQARELLNGNLAKFIGNAQKQAILTILKGEEAEFMAQKMIDLNKTIETMPKSYETDGKKDAKAILHYFKGSADWYIFEKDIEDGVSQAFGYSDLFGDGGELGYISITEVTSVNAEIDLYFKPLTLDEIKAKQ